MRFAFLTVAAATLLPAQSLQFDFISAKPAAGFRYVAPGSVYSEDTGYGFENSATEAPVYFSVRVPEEGNYKVTITLGDPAADSVTTIKAELRRLMLERVRVPAGQTETRSFIVNVRTPSIPGGGEVRLKDREKTSETRAWDRRLTIEFTDSHPAVRTLAIEKAGGIPTIYIVGDSTTTDQPDEPYNSWGQMLPRFFKPEVAVANHGESGESLRGFLSELRWAKVLSAIKPGDYVLIQMGHNDQKERGEGVGAFTIYKTDLKRFVADAREHGATPVLITSVNRLTFGPDGKIVSSLGDYPEAVRQAAAETGSALIDLNAMSKLFYDALGPADGHLAFAGTDTTHHNNYGSYELAKCIVEGIKLAKLPIAKSLVDMPSFDPAHPDPVSKFDIPAEPPRAVQRPYGN